MTETFARKTFVRNMARMAMLANSIRETKGLQKELERRQAKFAAGKPAGDVERVRRRLERRKTGLAFLYEWQAVMYVTFTETYLQDALAAVAGVDARLMGDSKQSASYSDVSAANSLEELAYELRNRWARAFIESGGPSKWIERLTKMGARGFSASLGSTMEQLWGVRHLIVHRAGVADLNLTKHHPELRMKPGMQVELPQERIAAYATATEEFVAHADNFFSKAYPLLGEGLTLASAGVRQKEGINSARG